MMQPTTPQETITALSQFSEPISFSTSASRAFILISQLQLALRHPDNDGPSSKVTYEFIQNMTTAITTVTGIASLKDLVDMGFEGRLDGLSPEQVEHLYGLKFAVIQEAILLRKGFTNADADDSSVDIRTLLFPKQGTR